ncbi:MAG: energy-dependent translational throttle protein EttA [Myxococcota bacterium]|nr:energy-dependent translational throttle protein EttA [Myxococcota bacterium]
MAKQFIFQMHNLTKRLDNGRELLSNFGLSFYPGAKIGIIGANGAGKSTILKIMAGIDTEYEGHTWRDPSATIGYLAQEPKLDPDIGVRGNVEKGMAHLRALLDEFDQVNEKFAEVMDDDQMDALLNRQAELQDAIDAADAWELDRKIEIAMDALRVPDHNSDITKLSGGEKRRVALCSLLLSKPDLLLLDEPTNHLDAESVAWLETHLQEYAGTVIFVTHDRYFLDNVSRWILEIDNGRGVPWEGNYSSWLAQKQKKMEAQKRSLDKRKVLARELEWIQMGRKARKHRNKARIRQYEQLLTGISEEEQHKKRLDIGIPNGPRLGDLVIRARNLQKGFGERLLIEKLDFDIPKGAIVGIIGANGAGKTTLFRMIVGEDTPGDGELTVGSTVRLAYVNQHRDDLKAEGSVWENITGGNELLYVGDRELNSRAYVSAFGFRGARQNQKVGTLSGGERNRVHLAKLLQSGGNVLLLDEPTNDLDVATLRTLEEALEAFAGCAMVISHDRWFLNRMATHILAFEGNSSVVWFEGNYEDYEVDRRRRLGEDAQRPTRIRYKPLER